MAWKPALHGISFHSPRLCTPQSCSQGPNALSSILFCRKGLPEASSGPLHFAPKLTPTSCNTMSDSFALLGSQFVKETFSDRPLQGSPFPVTAIPTCGPLPSVYLVLVCLPPQKGKVCESRETLAALLLPYPGICQDILVHSRKSISTCQRDKNINLM